LWTVLSVLLARPSTTRKKLPQIYLFLSRESKGSLTTRTPSEKDLVHSQQFRGEGVALIDPPIAWVSSLDQVSEESAHLYAIVNAPHSLRPRNKKDEQALVQLHEAFAFFAEAVSTSPKIKLNQRLSLPKNFRSFSKVEKFWIRAHYNGYRLGQKWARSYFSGTLTPEKMRRWFRSWGRSATAPR